MDALIATNESGQAVIGESTSLGEILALREAIAQSAGNGTLDIAAAGTAIDALAIELPPASPVADFNTSNSTRLRPRNRTLGEMQRITCAGEARLAGNMTLSFNGATTRKLSVAELSGLHVIEELQALDTVGEVGANAIVEASRVEVTVEFALSTSLEPFNWGRLPLLQVGAQELMGLGAPCTVERLIDFVYEVPDYTFAEQTIIMNTTTSLLQAVNIHLSFRQNRTEGIPALAGSSAVRSALSNLSTIGNIEAFVSHDPWGADGGLAVTWTVRFYPPSAQTTNERVHKPARPLFSY